jgi:hypothetical protein
VSTQNAADTEACFRTYARAVVQLLIEVNGITTAPAPVTVTTITDMLTTRATNDTSGTPVVTVTDVVVTALVTETWWDFGKKISGGGGGRWRWCGAVSRRYGTNPVRGRPGVRHLPRGLLRGRAAFTEGERCIGGFTGCGALVVVGFFGASTIGLPAMSFAF